MGTTSEKDMQVREIKEGYKFADKLFAKYPLLGNAILKESTQDKINEQAKKALDILVENPSYVSSMPINWYLFITLATINYAKNGILARKVDLQSILHFNLDTEMIQVKSGE